MTVSPDSAAGSSLRTSIMQQRFRPCMSVRLGVDQLQLGESSVSISDKPSTPTGIFLSFTALHCPFPCKVPCILRISSLSSSMFSLSLHLSHGSPVTLMGSKSRHSHSHRGSEAAPAVTQTYTHAHIYRTRTKITCWDRHKLKTPHTESQTDGNGHQHTPSPHYTA